MTKTIGITTDDDPGKPCVFPFKSGNITYNQCAYGTHGSWCATEVAADRNKIQWGYCHMACPGGTFVGPSDAGGTCPDGSVKQIIEIIDTAPAMDHCCCGDSSCCWNKCYGSPPDSCLPSGAEWKLDAKSPGRYQAVQACMTKVVEGVTNDDPEKPCIFPFVSGAVTYNECTNSSGTGPWCATEVDTNGVMVDNKWGFCNTACPGGVTIPTYPSCVIRDGIQYVEDPPNGAPVKIKKPELPDPASCQIHCRNHYYKYFSFNSNNWCRCFDEIDRESQVDSYSSGAALCSQVAGTSCLL